MRNIRDVKKRLGHFGVMEAKEKGISRSLEVNYASWVMKVKNNEDRKTSIRLSIH